MKDAMIDLETFGTTHDAVIVQIGACYFDRRTGKVGKTFSVNVNAQSCLDRGMSMDSGAIYWWLEQSEAARNSIIAKPRTDILTALNDLKAFLKRARMIWSHATFDFVIINNALVKCGYKPLSYRSARDIRTLTDLAGKGEKFDRDGTHHNALADCIYQVKYVVDSMSRLNNS